jgi:hypothetical protein
VAVIAAPPLFYRWQRNGTNLDDGGNLAGSATRILSLSNITTANAGTYSVVVTNALGSVISAGASLFVISPPAFQTITKTNGALRLAWNSIPGQKYQLQYKSILNSADWTNLGNIITATNSTAFALDLIGSNSQRFYRVVLLP